MKSLIRWSALLLAVAASVALAQPAKGKTEVTWWGHAAFVIRSPQGAVIAIDPWLTNPKAPKGMAWPEKVDAILVSHGHFDHTGDTVELAKKTGAQVIAAYELVGLLGVENGNGMNVGGSVRVKDVTIHLVPAVHSSGFGKDVKNPQYGGNPVGFVLQIDGGPTLYHAGDTDVFGDMALIAQQFHPSVAMLPIGGHFTMDPTGAALAAKFLRVRTVIPMHYGTFPALAGTPEQLASSLKKGRVPAKVLTLTPGQTIKL